MSDTTETLSALERAIETARAYAKSTGRLFPKELISEAKRDVALLQALRDGLTIDPVAKVVSKYGDPEAFGEREIEEYKAVQQLPYNTELYALDLK